MTMKKRILVIVLILFSLKVSFAGNQVVGQLITNLNIVTLHDKAKDLLQASDFQAISRMGRFGGADDVKLFLEVNCPDSVLTEWLNAQSNDGSWPDINYADKSNSSWDPKVHVIRFQVFTKSYHTPTSRYYHSLQILSAIHKTMAYWFEKRLVCPNWWYNDIGIPMYMGPGFLLMKDQMSSSELAAAERVMNKKVFRATGQNKVWDAGNAVMHALLTDNMDQLLSARDSILSEVYMSNGEGLQPDYSFHQHGPMMQFGNYGLAYISNMAYWARIFSGTKLAFPESKMDYLRDYLLKGIQWTVWKGRMDYSACARQVFQQAQRSKSYVLCVAIQNFLKIDSHNGKLFNRFIQENLFDSTLNSLNGHKYFYRSEYGVHRTSQGYISVRMSSNRTKGVEMTNRENLQGAYAADGAMSILTHGREYDDIFPIWNWYRLPGITAREGIKATVDYRKDRPGLTGGLSNGQYGIETMDVSHDGLQARKSWFFLENQVVCLGSGITADGNFPVYTTLNQPLLHGNIYYYNKGEQAPRLLDFGDSLQSNRLRGVWHDSVAYVLLTSGIAELSSRKVAGNWNRIADFYRDIPVSGNLFTLSLFHGRQPHSETYAYAVCPGLGKDKMSQYLSSPGVQLLCNNDTCQAISDTQSKMLESVFHRAGTLRWNGMTVTVSDGVLLMISKIGTSNRWKLVLADPAQILRCVDVTIRRISSKTTELESQPKTYHFDLPQSIGEKGKTIESAPVQL
jgi:chondroitin AC lyase